MKGVLLAAFAMASILLTACSSHPSVQQTMVDDRFMVYNEMYKAYAEAEKNYLNLLFNIERMPDEEELWMMKRDRMLELLQLRELMLSARAELDDALKDWEKHLTEVQGEVQRAKIVQYNPNFSGKDAKRTSPGQLLPEEAYSKNER